MFVASCSDSSPRVSLTHMSIHRAFPLTIALFALPLSLGAQTRVDTTYVHYLRAIRATAVRASPSVTGRLIKRVPVGTELAFGIDNILEQNGWVNVLADSGATPIYGYVPSADVQIKARMTVVVSPLVPERKDSVVIRESEVLSPIRPDVASAIDAPDLAVVKVFGTGKFTVFLMQPMIWKIGSTNDTITVPTGFVTDFASIPRALWTLLSPTGPYRLAAVVHDWLYWDQGCTRDQADNLLYIAMQEERAGAVPSAAVYSGVRFGGSFAWDGNRAERARGEPRVLTAGFDSPPALASWQQWRLAVKQRGLTSTPVPVGGEAPAYCARGNVTSVP